MRKRGSLDALISLAWKVAANPTPNLLERWTEALSAAGVDCPFGCQWSEWVRQIREDNLLDRLPWER